MSVSEPVSSKTVLAAAVLFAVVVAGNGSGAWAGEGDFVVRLQGLGTLAEPEPAMTDDNRADGNRSDGIWAGGLAVPQLGLSYFITDNIAAGITLDGIRPPSEIPSRLTPRQRYGAFQDMPPAVSLQYFFLPDNGFKAYVGAGIDYTAGAEKEAGLNDANRDYGANFSYAFQAGFDYYFRQDWAINFDLKTVFIDKEASLNSPAASGANEDLNPWVVGVGFTFRF